MSGAGLAVQSVNSGSARRASILPDKTPPIEAVRPKTVPARHAASLIVLRRRAGCEPEMLMGMRGAGHKFSPNRLVFPGGAVDRADLRAQALTSRLSRQPAGIWKRLPIPFSRTE